MWYNTTIAATKLKVCRRTIYNLIKKGYLDTKKGNEGTMVWITSNMISKALKKNKRLLMK